MIPPRFRHVAIIAVSLILAGSAWYMALWVEKLPARLKMATQVALEEKARELRARFLAVANFEPRMRIQDRVLAETTFRITQVAVLEKNTELQREFTHTWAGSSKMLRLRGKYRVKIGFDLLDRFEIQIENGKSRLWLPPATILSVEQTELHVEALENGYWNPISAYDLETSIAALQQQARSQSQSLVLEAENQFRERLRQMVDPNLEFTSPGTGQP